jgi:hypothetical protein
MSKRLLLLMTCWLTAGFCQAAPPLTDYELVAASQTAQVLGPNTITTKSGMVLAELIIVPETTGAGTVSIKDGSGTAIDVFIAGTLADLHTIVVPINARSAVGSWQVTTGSNVHVIAVGSF